MKTFSTAAVLWLMIALAVLFTPASDAGINISGAGLSPLKMAYSSLSVDLSVVQTNTVLNVNEAGTLIGIHGRVLTAPAGGVGASTSLGVTVDGQSASLVVWPGGGVATWAQAFSVFKSAGAGFGDQNDDVFHIPLALPYASNASVQVVASGGTGTLLVGVVRGVRF